MTHIKDVFGNDLFGRLQPFTIGFDETMDMLRKTAEQTQKAVGYPPYNIKQVKENKYVIEMAVAGFAKTDLEITMDGNKLLVKGSTKDEEGEQFLYKGIANRGFERAFTLNDKVEIKDAELVNGMLKIWLENIVKAQDAIKKIGIKEKTE
jgi:molecular chaperone IbpA